MWNARFYMSFHVKLRYVLKALTAGAWVVILPITYSYSWKNPSGFEETIKNWFGNGESSPSMFIIAVVIYLFPNILSGLLFLLPFIRRNLEKSDYKIVRFVMWWSQVWKIFLQLMSLLFYLLLLFLAIFIFIFVNKVFVSFSPLTVLHKR